MGFFEDKISENASLHFEGIDRVLVAVSGGADSVAMAHVLVDLQKKEQLSCEFVIGHVNHCLRGAESDADEAFVRELGVLLGVPVVAASVDVKKYAAEKKLSIETAGRQLRLQTLAEMATEYKCDSIATAHHADDQAETMIHRLMRGTGFRGLSGIKPVSIVGGAVYIRPMLNLRRNEIIQYCRDNSIQWRQDKSNRDLQFTRNRIRHKLLPFVKGESDLTDLLIKLSTSAQHLQQRVDDVFRNSFNELCVDKGRFSRICYKQEKLSRCSPWTFYEIIRQGIITIGRGLRGYSRSHFDAIRNMASQSKAKADFPGKLEVIVENGTVVIQRRGYKPSTRKQDEGMVLWPGHTVEYGPWKISSRLLYADKGEIEWFLKTKDNLVEWFDADKIALPLMVRARQKGDRFRPIGTKSSKKVARFLQDAQLAAEVKQNVFVVADSEKILWVAPVRMSDKVKISDKTTRVVEVRLDEPCNIV